jgi:hypothetical protein
MPTHNDRAAWIAAVFTVIAFIVLITVFVA